MTTPPADESRPTSTSPPNSARRGTRNLAEVRALKRQVKQEERRLARWRSITRVRRAAAAVATVAFVTGLIWTTMNWSDPSRFVKTDIVCGVLLVLALAGGVVAQVRRRTLPKPS
jgi:uncharacterized membrane protein